jgi:hypothetical protein
MLSGKFFQNANRSQYKAIDRAGWQFAGLSNRVDVQIIVLSVGPRCRAR